MIDYTEYIQGFNVMRAWFEKFYQKKFDQMLDNTEHIIAPVLSDYEPIQYPFSATSFTYGGNIMNLFNRNLKFAGQSCIVNVVNVSFHNLNDHEQMMYYCIPIFDMIHLIPWASEEKHVLWSAYAPVLINGFVKVIDVMSISSPRSMLEACDTLEYAWCIPAAYGADNLILIVDNMHMWEPRILLMATKYNKLFDNAIVYDTRM